MVGVTSITGILNQWNELGVFSYVLPFLLIFAVVFGVLSKTKIFEDNRGVNAIIALSVAMLSLQFDLVSTFFAIIFPRAGMGIAVLLVIVILMGIFLPKDQGFGGLKWAGFGVAIAVILWSITQWDWWADSYGVGFWFAENFWALIVGLLIVLSIYLISRKPKSG